MTERSFNAMQYLQTCLAQTTGSEANYLGVKKIPHVGSHHNPKEHKDLAIRSAQTQKINNNPKKFPGKIHNRPNKTRMSAAMSSTHKASDHQQGLHQKKNV
jgi:hypothetical protein